jgi:hypothetical protein
MSQRDLVAELRAARVPAPVELRERVRLVASAAPAPTRRLTWRRALVVVVPLAAAVAATIVVTRPSHERAAVTVQHGSIAAAGAQPSVRRAAAPEGIAVPNAKARVQTVDATLALRVQRAAAVSDAVKRAVRIVGSLGGFAASVHANTFGRNASADLTLKVPRAHVQQAMTRLAQLGTITAEQVDVTDQQAGLNATDREIARLQKQIRALRAQPVSPATTRRIAALTAQVQRLQRSEAETRRTAHYATVSLHVSNAQPAGPPKHHGHGPLHGVVVALRWLGIGAVYALAVGVPVAIVLVLAWLAVRLVRRRREDALLGR